MSALTDLSDSLKATDFDEIPIIDLSNLRSSDPKTRSALAKEIRDASLSAGFFYVNNHSVPEDLVQQVFQQSERFFALPKETKQTVDISKSSNFRGWMGLLTENQDPTNKGELHEAFNIGLDPSLPQARSSGVNKSVEGNSMSYSDNQWPRADEWRGADEFRDVVLRYYSSVLSLGQALFPLFALALGLREDFFNDKTQHPAAVMRLLFYPLQQGKVDDKMPGIGAHTDYECFTILRQGDVPGLQVRNRKGNWLDAPCIPGTFLINIGDQFARWTNDIFTSTVHRARPATVKDRYSIPLFFGVDYEVPMIPPPTCVSTERPNRYEVMKAGEYVHTRLSESYKTSNPS